MRWIFGAKPQQHVSIGLCVDGFIANMASFRDIEVFDVRPINAQIQGIVFKQTDLMCSNSVSKHEGVYCDSLSCLHAIEYFGFGRYSDPNDLDGDERNIANMVLSLRLRGTFYLSTSIGQECAEFNTHRVFDPRSIISFVESHGLALQQLKMIDGGGGVRDVEVCLQRFKVLLRTVTT